MRLRLRSAPLLATVVAIAGSSAGLMTAGSAQARGAITYTVNNGQVDMSIQAAFRSPPTVEEIDLVRTEATRAARILCDATDAAVRLTQVTLTNGDGAQENADVWFLPTYSRSYAGEHIALYRGSWNGEVLAHELGHYAFGIGDSYREPRRNGGCGIGFSFDEDVRLDETWHSIMQQTGGQQCQDASGRFLHQISPFWWWGAPCQSINDCPEVWDGTGIVRGVRDPASGGVLPVTCPAGPVLYSELSVAANHDQRQGSGESGCPAPRGGRNLTVAAQLNPNDAVASFDGSTFESASASVEPYLQTVLEVIDGLGRVEDVQVLYAGQSSHKIGVYFEHAGVDQWNLHVIGRGDEYVGGVAGAAHSIATLTLDFTGSVLTTVNGQPAANPVSIELGGTATGAFVAGSDGSTAAPVALDVRLGGVVQEPFLNPGDLAGLPTGFSALNFFETRVTHGEPGAADEHQVGICADTPMCTQSWNENTGEFETASHTIAHGNSDWEAMRAFVAAEAGVPIGDLAPIPNLPTVAPPTDAECGIDPATFIVQNVNAPDEIVMVLDRSGSMSADAAIPWAQPQTRLAYVQAAASLFVDLYNQRAAKVGLITFNDEVDDVRAPVSIHDAPPPGAPSPTVPPIDFHNDIEGVTADGATAIGTALNSARAMLAGSTAASKAVLLLSDGENNSGAEDPETEGEALRTDGVTVFTVPVGNAADRMLSASLARGGRMFDAPVADETPAAFLEAYARSRSEALVIMPQAVSVAPAIYCSGGEFPCPGGLVGVDLPELGCLCLPPGGGMPAIPPAQTIDIPVEPGAEQLNLLLSSRNPTDQAWDPNFELSDPNGTAVVTEVSPSVITHDLYRLVKLPNPVPGTWKLRVSAGLTGTPDQHSYAAAHIENPGPDCFASVSTDVALPGEPVTIKAEAYYGGSRIYTGVTFTGWIQGPDGVWQTIFLERDPNISSVPEHSTTVYLPDMNGVWDVRIACDVSADAGYLPGESIYAKPGAAAAPVPDTEIIPFTRMARASIQVDSNIAPPLPSGTDCDNDGILDADEPAGDTDGDGQHDVCDDDADNDDVWDGVDADPTDYQTGVCDLEPSSIACCDEIWSCAGVAGYAVYADGELSIADRAVVRTPEGEFASIVNAGIGETNLGVESQSGTIYSAGPVVLRDRAFVDGDVSSAETVTVHNDVTVTGDEVAEASLGAPSLSTYSVDFPAPDLGDVYLAPDQEELTLQPGSYGTVSVMSRSSVRLTAGVYFVETVQVLEPQAEIHFDTTNGPIYLLARDAFIYRGAFIDVTGRHDQVFVGYFGTDTAFIETPFSGTFVAPTARVKIASAQHYGGFYAQDVEIYPGAVIEYHPFAHAWPVGSPVAPSCEDGLANGAETDVDCGGGLCDACIPGQICLAGSDCTSGLCEAGICQESATGCDEATAIDLGGQHTAVTVTADACIKVTQYPGNWVAAVALQTQSGGVDYPIPYTWNNCDSTGTGTLTSDWSQEQLRSVSDACTTLIQLQGSASGAVTLKWWGTG